MHTPGGGIVPPPGRQFGILPQSPLSPSSEYQYGGPMLPSSIPIRGVEGMATYATISPPMSPAHSSRPAPQAPPQYPEGRRE